MFTSKRYLISRDTAESVFLLAYIAEVAEWDNRTHLQRIKGYAYALCTELGIPRDEAELIALASQLHDIGKSATPDKLLLHEGTYTPSEWQVMEKHTIDGERMLKGLSSPVMRMGAIIALTHHERWDGSGYPNGTAGEDIPLSGRICAVVDVFDALSSERFYKSPIDDEQSFDLLRKSSRVFFDPQVVQAFFKVLPEIIKIKDAREE